MAIKYPFSLCFDGSYAGHYCKDCDLQLMKSEDVLHQLYRAMADLRRKNQEWSKEMRKAADKCEAKITDERERRGGTR